MERLGQYQVSESPYQRINSSLSLLVSNTVISTPALKHYQCVLSVEARDKAFYLLQRQNGIMELNLAKLLFVILLLKSSFVNVKIYTTLVQSKSKWGILLCNKQF